MNREGANDAVVSYLTLRQLIGWVGLLMPITVRLGAWIFEGIATTGSISAYYYTGMRDLFVSSMVLVGALLTCNRTPERRDTVLYVAAGIAAIGIGLCPMDPQYSELRDAAGGPFNSGIRGLHFPCVVVFFALLLYLVYFRFTAFTPRPCTHQKEQRNTVYRVCAVVMLLAFLAIGALAYFRRGASIFWPEAVAVAAFAYAWLVKGQRFFRDPDPAN